MERDTAGAAPGRAWIQDTMADGTMTGAHAGMAWCRLSLIRLRRISLRWALRRLMDWKRVLGRLMDALR